MGYHIANRRIQNTRFGELVPVPATDFLPAGTIIQTAQEEPSDGWLECNGAKYKRNDFPKLYEVMYYWLPDWPSDGTDYDKFFLVPDMTQPARGKYVIWAGVTTEGKEAQ